MSEPMTADEHALRIATLEALAFTVAAEYENARAEAEPVFAAIRKKGNPQQEVLLPNGEKIGLISIRVGVTVATMDPVALLAFVREYQPAEVEEHIDPAALKDPDIIEYVKAFHPGYAGERVTASTRKTLHDQAAKAHGYVVAADGEKAKIAEVSTGDPTGAFSLLGAGAEHRRNTIITEWRAGRIPKEILGPLALPAALPAGGDSSEG
jgi:hypothetical protein